ncbi:MAG TPA: tetratricopeptide repeat protein [Pseudolabrys sp.]|nr:tetratricopeptide repeat protein [Pseudolabrys sp.]
MPPSPSPQAAAQPAPLNVAQAFAEGLRLHEQGRLAEAERLYAAVLAARPDHFDALQMLAVVKHARGELAEALRLISQAMKLRRPSPQILLNYGMILHTLSRSDEAIESFDQALKQKSKFAEAHNNRGAVLSALGRQDEAIESLRRAIAIKADYPDAHYNLGSALRELGRHEEALASFDRSLRLRPDFAKAHNNRGASLEALQRLEEARAAYARAVALDPGFAEGPKNLGRVLLQLDRGEEAVEIFNTALRLKPDDAETWYLRGRLFVDLGRNDEALADLAQALALRPDHAGARFAECIAELAIVYSDEAEIGRRRAAYERKLRALAADVAAERLNGDLVAAIGAQAPFLLAYQGGNDRPLQEIYGGMVHTIVARAFTPPALPPPPAPGEPIRVGIASAHFFGHSNWKIPIKGWLGQLDRSRFKVTGYHLGVTRDANTEAAERLCDRFVHRPHDVKGWREEILADAPHVLIYPGLLMDTRSLQLAAQRLAPVQMTSWGHPETSGLPTLDYFLSSDLMEAEGAQDHYTEKLVRLPNLSIYYEPVNTPPEPVTRAELGLRETATVFWSAQSLYKYLPQHDDIYARIARDAGDCQIVFVRHHGGAVTEFVQARLARAFARYDLDVNRHCVFLSRMSQGKFVAAAGLADILLDSIGWSACNSALESLAHDLPIVTYAGPMMRGRHSTAILRMLGVPETVAATPDDVVRIAVDLARNPDMRRAIVARMAREKHRLYFDRAPVAALEALLEQAVRG